MCVELGFALRRPYPEAASSASSSLGPSCDFDFVNPGHLLLIIRLSRLVRRSLCGTTRKRPGRWWGSVPGRQSLHPYLYTVSEVGALEVMSVVHKPRVRVARERLGETEQAATTGDS